jgi:hypothetical protein
LFLLVFGAGLRGTNLNWLEVSDVQVFEGDGGVVLFVEIERTKQHGGFPRTAPIESTIQLLRIEVSKDGRSSLTPLKFGERTTFNTTISPIIKLPDHFYLVEEPSMGRPSCQLHRVAGDCIESLSFDESGSLLQAIGLRCGGSRGLDDFAVFDRISERNGWRRLNHSSSMFKYDSPVVSHRHKLRLSLAEEGQSQAIVADSFTGPSHWSKILVTVNTRRWKS